MLNLARLQWISLVNWTHQSADHDLSHLPIPLVEIKETDLSLAEIVEPQSNALCWQSSTSAHDARLKSVRILFKRSTRSCNQSWVDDGCAQSTSAMHQRRARLSTASCFQLKLTISQIPLTVSHFNIIFFWFQLSNSVECGLMHK